jgi:hypothetical protein
MKKLLFILFINFLPAQQKWNLQQCLDYAMKNSPEVQQSIINVNKNQRQINSAKEICFLRLMRVLITIIVLETINRRTIKVKRLIRSTTNFMRCQCRII